MHDNSAESRAVPSSALVYHQGADSFVCPEGQQLNLQGIMAKATANPLVICRTRPKQCASCPSKANCCGKTKTRSVSHPNDGCVRKRTLIRR